MAKKRQTNKKHRAHGRRRKERSVQATVEGILHKHRRGYGFVEVEDSAKDDIFITPRDIGEAMNGDRVLAEVLTWANDGGKKQGGAARGEGKGPRGRIVKVLERACEEVVGRFEEVSNFGFVVPLDKNLREDIFVAPYDRQDARDGDLVLCRILRYPGPHHGAEGQVAEVIAHPDDPRGERLALLRQHRVPVDFPAEAMTQAQRLKERGICEEDLAGRLDLRGETIVTIDGADSKDFDDAVSCCQNPDGSYRLGVHIADVGRYVPMDSPLDHEAMRRGNSHYLLDMVVPMLPPELSDDLCSLRPEEDRLTLSCVMDIDARGQVLRHDIRESVIRSGERLVYTDVSDILEGCRDKERETMLRERYRSVLPLLKDLESVYHILRRAREERGGLDFATEEAEFTLNEAGQVVEVARAERRVANRMIEECMCLANEVVAKEYCLREVPFLYRVHERPEEDRAEELDRFLRGFGLGFTGRGGELTPREVQRILHRSAGESFGPAVHQVVLRSMQKAYYDPHCLGHFGLALSYYSHFTSPIRRYADLFIHRIIKADLAGRLSEEKEAFRGRAPEAAKHASACETVAVELEREVEKRAKAEYMRAHLGEVYPGVVSGVTRFGFYVALENTVEGLVSLDSLRDDRYLFDEKDYCLVGEYHKRRFRLGDRVEVQVAAADPQEGEVDFHCLA